MLRRTSGPPKPTATHLRAAIMSLLLSAWPLGAARGEGHIRLQFREILAGDERGLPRIDPPALAEAAEVKRVEAELVVEPGDQLLGRGVVSSQRERAAFRVTLG